MALPCAHSILAAWVTLSPVRESGLALARVRRKWVNLNVGTFKVILQPWLTLSGPGMGASAATWRFACVVWEALAVWVIGPSSSVGAVALSGPGSVLPSSSGKPANAFVAGSWSIFEADFDSIRFFEVAVLRRN